MEELTNKEVALLLEELADLMKIRGDNKFKIRAYTNAARNIMDLEQDLTELYKNGNLQDIKGVGEGLAGTIEEILQEGTSNMLQELKTELPSGVLDLLELPGLGPARAHTLYYELEIADLDDLEQAIAGEKLRELKGFGPEMEEKLKKSLQNYRQYEGTLNLAEALSCAEEFAEKIANSAEEIKKIAITGSVRRKKDLVRSIDFILIADNLSDRESFVTHLPFVEKIVRKQEAPLPEISVLTGEGLKINLVFATERQFPVVQREYTGSKKHNENLYDFFAQKEIAAEILTCQKQLDKGAEETEEVIFGQEKDIYQQLKMDYIIPELREGQGEVEAAFLHQLPDSVTLEEIKGDLHVHSRYSDGAYELEDMARAARERGYEYLGFTDHSQSLKVAHGLSPELLQKQGQKISELQQKFTGIKILKGIESDILTDGSLDYSDDVLAELDYVIASIHTGFNQSREKITSRIIAAIKNPYVNIIGHPQGRLLGRRSAYEVDIKKVIDVAAEYNTALEINASPSRLDLDDKNVKYAKEQGVKIVINTDAHHLEEFSDMQLGVAVARRGWLEAKDVLNTMSYDQLLSYFRGE
ncbi:MAG: DNA polymerase/3'-5' exonuclease PolX [Bacillota bacterium]